MVSYPDAVLAAELPKVTDWMQAWGSLIGVFVSALAVIITGLLLRHEMRARRQDKEDRDAAQARLVSTRLELPEVGLNGYVENAIVTLKNHSDAPIHALTVVLREGGSDEERGFVGLDDADSPYRFEPYVSPGEELQFVYGFNVEVDPGDLMVFGEIHITFIDASGLSWSKVDTKAPVRLHGLNGKPRRGDTFWSVLWVYLWPISAPVGAVARFRDGLRLRAQESRQAVMRHMGNSINRRNSKRYAALNRRAGKS
ncbi:hypothetical protein CSH63_01100 [Micromonospora tulbaghiae]|uniref:Uncharacterized protein n=1 Tax=Micromonospora tulbaghiae TaxID=479978 RepID=A0A386WD33_9ACTN|nr:hypothetical protein CSH63_01100 [Micromonospora tulbaghiae]